MHEPMLFYTAVPVLLGGCSRDAGRMAAMLYTRHGVTLRWFGQGWHPLVSIYAARYPLSVPLSEDHDPTWLRLLLDFAKAQKPVGGILCLIPGSAEASAFLARIGNSLDAYYVILESPGRGEDPLYGLVHSH